MLAHFLRRLILVQLLGGGLLGWWLARQGDGAVAWAGLGAVLMPVVSTKLVIFISALRSRAPGDSGLWWRAIVSENLSTLRLMLLKMPWTWHASGVRPALGSPERIPVVLVHGYVCNHRIWDTLTEHLRPAGHPVLSLDLEPIFTSIDDYAPLIEQAVERLCRETGAPRLALVGHSMGGLAIRAWMRRHGTARVVRVITLGTPHAGTRIDPYPLTPNSLQMVWQSPWLQTLAASESDSIRALIRIALTPQDNIVYPQREQVLPKVPVQIFDGLGHVALCDDRKVINWVLSELSPNALLTPGPVLPSDVPPL